MKKTAILGASGYIGKHLFRRINSIVPDTIGTFCHRHSPGLHHFDLVSQKISTLKLKENGYSAVIITSGLANVEQCERERDATFEVNVKGVLEIVRQLEQLSLHVLFVSSDYVFDGVTGGYEENSAVGPQTEYGKQKVAVEQGISQLTASYTIVRLSKIYGVENGDGTFLTDMATTLRHGRKLQAASDQIFCPTYIDDAVNCILKILNSGNSGTYHVASPEAWSRYEIAAKLARALGAKIDLVESIKLGQISGPAKRPLNTSMKCMRIARERIGEFVSLQESMQKIATSGESSV